MIAVLKICAKCGIEKPEDDWYPSIWKLTNGRCKTCFKQYDSVVNPNRGAQRRSSKRYREKNKAHVNAKAAEWRRDNPERVKENWRSWYDRNADRQIVKARAWYEANPERVRARAASPTERARKKAWKKANPDKVLAATRFRRARKAEATVEGAPVTAEGLAARCAMWGNACWICKGPYQEVDHVKPMAAGGLHILANLRPICAPCNRRKQATWPLTNLVTRPAIPDILEEPDGS